MTATVSEAGAFERLVTFTVPADDLRAAENGAARRLSHDLRIPGFRPGRAPRPIVEQHVGKDRIRSDALDELLPPLVTEILSTEGITPAASPGLEAIRDTDAGVEVDVRVAIWPSLGEAPDYVGREVEVTHPAVTDEELETQLEAIRGQFADVESVDRPAAEGDVVVIDLAGTKDGEPYESLAADGLFYEIGSGQLFEGLDEAVTGASAGDVVTFDGVLPDGWGEDAGADVTYEVTLSEVREKRVPDLDDAWVDENTEFETADDFTETLRRRLGQQKLDASYDGFRRSLIDLLVGEVDLEIPEPIVRGEMDRLAHDFVHRLEGQDITLADYLQVTGQSEQGFIEDLEAQARRSISIDLVLDAVVEDAGIEVDAEELSATIDAFRSLAAEQGVDVAGTPQEQRVVTDMLRQKAMETLLKSAVPVDGDGTPVDYVSLASELAEPEDEGPDEEDDDPPAAGETSADDEGR